MWGMAGTAAFLLLVWLQSALKLTTRVRELAALAERWGMMPLERDMLPAGMTLSGTQLQRWLRIVNARKGESVAGLLGAIGADFVVERAGEWQAVFRPRQVFNINRPFMRVQQLEITLTNLSKLGGR